MALGVDEAAHTDGEVHWDARRVECVAYVEQGSTITRFE